MSKVDAQRAMREARYARIRASGPTRREAAAAARPTSDPAVEPAVEPAAAPPAPAPAPAARPARAPRAAVPTPAVAPAEDALCGHTSMNGRTCTRPEGHAEKSHRYG